MDFDLSEEQKMIQDSVRKLVERDIEPILADNDPDVPLPKDVAKRILGYCARQGLTSARVPEDSGGGGVSALTFGIMREQLPPVVSFLCGGLESSAVRICHGGSAQQKEKYVRPLIDGELISGTGTTEPGSGSDPSSVKTRAEMDGDDVVLTGQKIWISNASICDIMLVVASVGEDERGRSKLIRVIADQSISPFETRKTPTLGLRQGHMGEAFFEGNRYPRANIVGESDGESSKVLSQTWTVQRPMMGLLAVRMAERAYDAARTFAGERKVFGQKIGGFQLIQQALADIAVKITTSRLICYHALDTIDKGGNARQLSAMAKRYAIGACQEAISLAMEVHGAMGVSSELGLEQLYRDCRMLPIPDGTNQILTLIEGREITGQSAIRA